MNFSHLKWWIRESGYRKILVLGLGNELRGDDQAGLILSKVIERGLREEFSVKLILAGTNPENYLGEVISFSPDVVLVVDSADMGEKPGSVKMLREEMIDVNCYTTHTFSPRLVEEYVRRSINCDFVYVVIQGENFLFGKQVSDRVMKGIAEFK